MLAAAERHLFLGHLLKQRAGGEAADLAVVFDVPPAGYFLRVKRSCRLYAMRGSLVIHCRTRQAKPAQAVD
jgi:hypothetical protein